MKLLELNTIKLTKVAISSELLIRERFKGYFCKSANGPL